MPRGSTESKDKLLAAAAKTQRGLTASKAERAEVDGLARALERVNPNPKSLSAPEINGRWKLVYTTSESILGSKRPPFLRPIGPIYQTIDAEKLMARNNESWPYFNSVTAALTPTSESCAAVRFLYFKIFNVIPIKAPERARGSLDTTYVDSELRISRGDRGNLFVLVQDDPSARL